MEGPAFVFVLGCPKWVDEQAGTVFCLVEAPNEDAAHAVHREAHGLVADEIYEVQEGA